MKQLLFFLFFPMAVYGQTNNTDRSISGPFANRPVCSRDVSDSKAHEGDVYRDTDDEYAYKCLGGTWRIFRGGTTSPTNSTNPFVFDTKESDIESIDHVDIMAHGAYARFSSTTCNTRSGSPRVTLGATSNFKNGEFATCYNAGAATTVTRQATPTVTPSVHDGGMTVTAGGTGLTFYAYEIVGEDACNGRSAASSAGSTSGGNATLGKEGATLTGCTRSNQTVTCSGSNLPFVPGMQIWVWGAADTSFVGNWVTISPTNTTTLTWKSGYDTRNGASTSTTFTSTELSYNVWGWFLNRVSWAHDSSSYRHHIYGPNCPTTCNWLGQTMLDYWDDYGSAGMGANQARPSYMPAMAPSFAANQHFTFKITAGSGTTALTASTTAGASVSGNTIVSDAGPAIVAAATAATSSAAGTISNVLIPNPNGLVSWQINSYTNLYGKNAAILINGANLQVNQPIDNAASIVGIGGGSVQGFGWANSPKITGQAFPVIAQTGGAGTVPILKNLSISAGQSNGGLAVYLSTPTNIDWDTVALSSSPGSTSDCIGQAVVIQNISTGFFWNINKFLFSGGACEVRGTQYTGDSPVPFFTSTGGSAGGAGGGIYLKQGWFVNRGGVNLDQNRTGAGAQVVLERAWMQNNTVPALSWSGTYSGQLDLNRIVDIYPADFATPTFANYGAITSVIAENISGPNGGISSFTGNPIPNLIVRNSPGNIGTTSFSEFNSYASASDGYYGVGVNYITQPIKRVNEQTLIGNGYSLYTNAPTPPAPTCSVATAEPPYTPAGTMTFQYAATYPPNNGFGPFSASSSSCTSNGTSQRITITIPSAVNGATGYVFYASGTGLGGVLSCSAPATTGLTWVALSACGGGGAPTYPGGGPASMSQGNVSASNFILGATVAPTGATNTTQLYMDSADNWPAFKPNGNRTYVIPGISGSIIAGHSLCSSGTSGAYVDCLATRTIAVGTSTLGTTLIAAKSCSTVVTIPATGVITTDVVSYSFNGAPSGAYTAGLVIQSYVTPGNVNFLVCNPTANSLLPSSATLNWRVVR